MDKYKLNPPEQAEFDRGYRDGYAQEMAARKALKESGHEAKAADEKQRNLLAVLIINIINAILALLGIPERLIGGSWKPPAPKEVARAAAADEAQKVAVDTPREVLRIARRIELGASIDGAKLSEPVLGALLTMSDEERGHLLNRNSDNIDRWIAVQQGFAAPDPFDNPRIIHAPRRSDYQLRREQGWSDNLDFAEEDQPPTFAR